MVNTQTQGNATCVAWLYGEANMLVLSRQRDETIVIDDSIRITIVDVRGDKVRIGVQAPRDVSVHRQEIYDAIQLESDKRSDDK